MPSSKHLLFSAPDSSSVSNLNHWSSGISINTDLNTATAEAFSKASSNMDISKINLAIVFVSSIYETAYSFDVLRDILSRSLNGQPITIIGCTTGGVVGTVDPTISNEPTEFEARPSISVILASLGDKVNIESFKLDREEMIDYISNPEKNLVSSGKKKSSDGSIALLFGAENSRPLVNHTIFSISLLNILNILAICVSTLKYYI